MRFSLRAFVIESNRIERIEGTNREEMEEYVRFLKSAITVKSLERFVDIVANAQLRDRVGMNVIIGNHKPMKGGVYVRLELEDILRDRTSAYATHREYETLHPFMDGNGRSGRVLWLKMMGGIDNVPLGFLCTWYYQSLQGER